MGPFTTPVWMKSLAWATAVIIALLNGWLLVQMAT
jgi:Mn2+/Fe2+ NRAMP family transporter